MTLYQWIAMDEMEKTEVLWDCELIGTYRDDSYLYTAFQLAGSDFYIETKRHIKHDVLHGMRAFKNPDLLMLYFDSMGKINLP